MLAGVLGLPTEVAALRAEVAELHAVLMSLRQAMPPMLVPVTVAAERLGVSVPTVRRLVRSGRLPSVKVGSSVRVDLATLRAVDDEEVTQLAAHARRGALGEITRSR